MNRAADRGLLAVLLSLLLVGGCASLGDVMSLSGKIKHAGFTDVSVNHNTSNEFDSLSISANGPADAKPDDIGRIVWDNYPEHIDELRLVLNGKSAVATEAQLKEAYGERKIALKPDDDAAAAKRVVMLVAGIIAGVMLLLLGGIVLIVVLVRRKRRSPQP
ncbi:hypothetical protein Lesp02_56160 [Lentzea sp. NBRC 105346]|uniref:hypothetical protein n=1 Tax=Lentzea sp. NBRC 105346 TaxID=3032205 RepID=UPI00249F9F56|nr:hypothetical protein [Lentzea sp. NBRC 105346]GLZ33428.1 hypothetical protein Lesp02_56160 [Lentzea sp. NBRC 105346]